MTAIQRSKLTWLLFNFVSTSFNDELYIVELKKEDSEAILKETGLDDNYHRSFFAWFPNKMEISKKKAASEKDAARIYIASILDWLEPQHILMSEIQ